MPYSKDIWSAGFGAISEQTIVSPSGTSILGNALIVNAAQPVFSTLYFSYNNIVTSMTAAHEWSTYAISRKGLRVSTRPKGAQRSTYFLSLPYRYAIPLMVCAALLHWLISQSIFLIVVEAYTPSQIPDPASNITTYGYSPFAMICGLALALVMVAALLGISMRRFASEMPVVGSCSMAIAAGCHGVMRESRREEGAFKERLMWGVMEMDQGNEVVIRHCGFSESDIGTPQRSNLYQ